MKLEVSSHMKKVIPFLNLVGLVIIVGYLLIDYFLVRIPDTIAIPVILLSIVLIIVGNIANRKKRKN